MILYRSVTLGFASGTRRTAAINGGTQGALAAIGWEYQFSYDAKTGMVIYRSHMHKSLKRNFQLMPGAQWLEMLCRHIPDRFEHLVRYAGWYANRVRGRRSAAPQPAGEESEDVQAVAIRARSTWVRLIHKVHEVDPLL